MIIVALFLGFLYGFGSVKGQFCMNSGFSNVIRQKNYIKIKSFITAILIPMTILPLIFTGLHLFEPTQYLVKDVSVPPLYLLATAVGSFLFGIFMYYTAGCGAGIFYKIGEKNTGAIIAVIGFVIGLYSLEKGFLNDFKRTIQQRIIFTQQPLWKSEFSLLFAIMISVFSIIMLYFLFRKLDDKPNGAVWGWKKTGVFIGVLSIFTWGFALLTNTSYAMAIIPGVVDGLDLNYSWGILFIFGIILGAFYSKRKETTKKFTIPKGSIIVKRFFGGIGLGASGSIAAGCTVGHGLTFAPLLGIGSIIAIFFIFLGSGLVGFLTRK